MIHYEDFWALSEHLRQNLPHDQDSIELRTAICRSYYYLFHYIKESFRSYHGIKFEEDYTDHRRIQEIFENEFGDPQLADKIFTFRVLRNDATYKLNERFDASDLEIVMNDAQDIKTEASGYAP